MSKTATKATNSPLHFLSDRMHILLLLLFSVLLSCYFVFSHPQTTPPCVNSDEAAFGYNAYSLLTTGADEYGNSFPLRLKSFGDYKMPLYSYLSVPMVGVFGLNDFGIRSLNYFIAILFPIVLYLLVKELFEKEEIGAIAALLISVSLGKGIVERQAHEALLASFLVTLSSYFFIKYFHKEQFRYGLLFVIALFLSLFAYQSSRLFALFFFVAALILFFIKKGTKRLNTYFLIAFLIAVSLFLITDVIYKPVRVQSLFFTSTAGFSMQINELAREGGNRIFYNKLLIGVRDATAEYLQYFSPQFLAENGDQNQRFGFQYMSPMTLFEYVFLLIGIYFLFKNKAKWRYFLLSIFLVSPITAALSWQDDSFTRAFFIIIPALIISSYGIYNILLLAAKKKILYQILIFFIILESVLLYYSWDFYYNHYPKRALVTRAWQCGYKELSDYIKNNYQKYDKFYITQKHGEPYIFLLYYLHYPPEKYQQQASLTTPDKYGFGQVEKFDKFVFSFPPNAFKKQHIVLIGYPDDFNELSDAQKQKIRKIKVGNEQIFWIDEL